MFNLLFVSILSIIQFFGVNFHQEDNIQEENVIVEHDNQPKNAMFFNNAMFAGVVELEDVYIWQDLSRRIVGEGNDFEVGYPYGTAGSATYEVLSWFHGDLVFSNSITGTFGSTVDSSFNGYVDNLASLNNCHNFSRIALTVSRSATSAYITRTIYFYVIDVGERIITFRSYDKGITNVYFEGAIENGGFTNNIMSEGFVYRADSLIDDYFTKKSDDYEYGYDVGYSNGFNNGYNQGFNEGFEASGSDPYIASIFTGILEVGLLPVNVFLAILNFEVFGINISGFVTALLTLSIIIIIVRFLFGGKTDDK